MARKAHLLETISFGGGLAGKGNHGLWAVMGGCHLFLRLEHDEGNILWCFPSSADRSAFATLERKYSYTLFTWIPSPASGNISYEGSVCPWRTKSQRKSVCGRQWAERTSPSLPTPLASLEPLSQLGL